MSPYVGRFAPSPTGPLHRGSLLAALASWLDARSHGGRWLVRIEDIDTTRCKPEFEGEILAALRDLGLDWDGEVLRQTDRLAIYDEILQRLLDAGQAFPCACTRKVLRARQAQTGSARYPGSCRAGVPPDARARAVRLRLEPGELAFEDRLLGTQRQDPGQDFGDFIIRRGDGLHAYQLVVVIDDGEQGITDIVRGADLLDSTGRQIALARRLDLPVPRFMHLPLVINDDGLKLSKQTDAPALDTRNPEREIAWALQALGQPPVDGALPDMLARAVAQWSMRGHHRAGASRALTRRKHLAN